MDIAVVGTGFIGGILGRALARAGHSVTFGSRHPADDDVAGDTGAAVVAVADALAGEGVVILAVPGTAVAELVASSGGALYGRLVIDVTNRMGAPVSNCRADLPPVRYARAFNTVGGENIENPAFADGPADMFFTAPEDDRDAVATVIEGVGMRPIYIGADQEDVLDALFRLWIQLAIVQKRGRRLALRVVDA